MKLAVSYLDLSLDTNLSSRSFHFGTMQKQKKTFFHLNILSLWNNVKAKKKILFNLNDYGSEESWKERACYEVYLKTQNLGAKSKANHLKVKFRKKNHIE